MLLLLALVAAIVWLPAPWSYIVVAVAALYELAEITVLVWFSRRRGATTGAEALPGSTAVVVEACRPLGQVRLSGELWRARCDEGADAGETVVVEALGPDLTLIVRRA
jgi:membrane protein implicated in regulation of membrane protease activity